MAAVVSRLDGARSTEKRASVVDDTDHKQHNTGHRRLCTSFDSGTTMAHNNGARAGDRLVVNKHRIVKTVSFTSRCVASSS